MPKKREGASVWWYIFLIVLFLLLLKTFKVLPDPPEYMELAVATATAVAVTGTFGWVTGHIIKIEHRLTTVENDIKTILQRLGKIETKLGIS